MENWSGFYAAAVGAAGALGGLLLAAVSVNIEKILAYALLPPRVAQTLITIGAALVLSSFALYPGQPTFVFGWEAVVVGLVVCVAGVWELPVRHQLKATDRSTPARLGAAILIVEMAGVPMLAGGLLLAFGFPVGFYMVATGVVLSYITTLVNGWVLLIEILR